MSLSLENMTDEQREQAVRLFSFVKQNPDIEKQIRREAKKKHPNMQAPDIELEEAMEKQRAEFQEELKKRDQASLDALQAQRRAEAHAKIKSNGLDPEEIEKVMVDENIANYDTAIKYVRAQKQLAPATAESVSPMTLPDTKGLWQDRNGFARKSAFDAINELKSRRVLGQ
jgi:hypothetical protein